MTTSALSLSISLSQSGTASSEASGRFDIVVACVVTPG
eukprot:CAMPEP_0184329084 /NCGR_PEP_ID=MMETSP1049-20130417/143959_1 /TAXON_ID=77928 /ORGANISM="Proteomonas sulcata, Strain CCMP704" /LENGTH=37 /DNA_ID= /DNA_START= /DNA_END= /DNA_ORIENTATION=